MEKTDIAIGIDIGGTNTVLGLVDRQGRCLKSGSIPTHPEQDAERLVARLHEIMSEMMRAPGAGYALRGIGIGAPNANYYHGTVESPPNLNWKGVVNVVALFKKFYDVPVAITNDANAAALGELKFGAGKGMRDFIVITLGTGLGSGIIANGELVYGHDGFAGELGHTTVYPDGRDCGCGRKGCLETYASATGICRTVFDLLARRRVDSELRNVAFRDLTAKMISDAARRNDPIALEAFEETGRVLGLKLADAVAHTSPEAIILFGGLAAAGDLIFEPTRRHFEAHVLNIFRGKVKLIPSGLHEGNTAVLGGAALIWNELDRKS